MTKNVINNPVTNCHFVPYVLSSLKPVFISAAKNKRTFQLMYITTGLMMIKAI